MHLLVTDVLACPHCGPEHGLILLADRMEDRRVREGRLGCSNCRSTYPITGGIADLDGEGGAPSPGPHAAFEGDPEEVAVRLSALLGLGDAPALALVERADPAVIEAASRTVPSVEWILPMRDAGPGARPSSSSVLRVSGTLPLKRRSLHAAALPFLAPEAQIRATASLVAPSGRLVACTTDPGLPERLTEDGLELLLFEEGVMVAERSSSPARPLHQLGAPGT